MRKLNLVKEILDLRSRLNNIYVKHSGKKLADIESLMDRDTFIAPDDAVKLGLIDKVVNNRDDIKENHPRHRSHKKNKIFKINI